MLKVATADGITVLTADKCPAALLPIMDSYACINLEVQVVLLFEIPAAMPQHMAVTSIDKVVNHVYFLGIVILVAYAIKQTMFKHLLAFFQSAEQYWCLHESYPMVMHNFQETD